jgi:hypothetical protein
MVAPPSLFADDRLRHTLVRVERGLRIGVAARIDDIVWM